MVVLQKLNLAGLVAADCSEGISVEWCTLIGSSWSWRWHVVVSSFAVVEMLYRTVRALVAIVTILVAWITKNRGYITVWLIPTCVVLLPWSLLIG